MSEVRIERFDVRGQLCPSTLLLALREVNRLNRELHAGLVEVEIVTDNRNATITVPNAMANLGLKGRVEKTAVGYRIRIGCTQESL